MNASLIYLVPHIFGSVSVNCGTDGTTDACATGLPQVSASHAQLTDVLQVLFATLSVVAVLIIVIAALRFILSQGNPEKTSNARKAIIYALVGLIISLSAEALVAFVLDKL